MVGVMFPCAVGSGLSLDHSASQNGFFPPGLSLSLVPLILPTPHAKCYLHALQGPQFHHFQWFYQGEVPILELGWDGCA